MCILLNEFVINQITIIRISSCGSISCITWMNRDWKYASQWAVLYRVKVTNTISHAVCASTFTPRWAVQLLRAEAHGSRETRSRCSGLGSVCYPERCGSQQFAGAQLRVRRALSAATTTTTVLHRYLKCRFISCFIHDSSRFFFFSLHLPTHRSYLNSSGIMHLHTSACFITFYVLSYKLLKRDQAWGVPRCCAQTDRSWSTF